MPSSSGLLIYRQFPLRRLYPMLVETAALSGAILLIIGTATAMAWALTQSGFSRQLAAAMTSMPGGAAGFMAVSIVAFIVLGSVLEGIPAIVLFGPLLFPSARAVGINEVHYAMVVDPGDGDRAVRATVRRRLLRGVRDRPGVAGCGDAADLAVSAGGAGGADRGGGGAVVQCWVSVGRMGVGIWAVTGFVATACRGWPVILKVADQFMLSGHVQWRNGAASEMAALEPRTQRASVAVNFIIYNSYFCYEPMASTPIG